jgi:hypothetical protein
MGLGVKSRVLDRKHSLVKPASSTSYQFGPTRVYGMVFMETIWTNTMGMEMDVEFPVDLTQFRVLHHKC